VQGDTVADPSSFVAPGQIDGPFQEKFCNFSRRLQWSDGILDTFQGVATFAALITASLRELTNHSSLQHAIERVERPGESQEASNGKNLPGSG